MLVQNIKIIILLIILRILSLFFKNHHKQRVDDIVKNKVLGKDVIKVEEIAYIESEQQTGINFYEEKASTKKDMGKVAKTKNKQN